MLTKETITPAIKFLSGGGNMGEFIRTMDWSQTSIGNPSGWPPSLRTSVSICLNSPSPLLIWWGKDLVKIYNDAYSELIATKHPQAMGANGADVWPEILPNVLPMLKGILKDGESTGTEDQLLVIERHGRPEVCYFTFSYSAIRDEDGNVGGIFCAVNETTKKVVAERKFSTLLNALFIQAPVAICIFRGENYVVEVVNKLMLDLWGRTENEILNKPVFEAIPEVKDQGFKELLNVVYTTGERFVTEEHALRVRRNGKMVDTFVKFIYEPLREEDGTISGIMGVAHDITEQVVARKTIEESEQRLRNLVEQAPSPICILKGEEMILEVANEPLYKVWNVNKKSLGKPFLKIIPEMKDQPFMGWLLDVFHNGTTHYGNEEPAYFTRRNGDKETIYFNFVYQPYRENDGTISGVMVLATDVTEQVVSRKKIEESNNRYYRMLMESPFAFSIMKGKDMVVTMANDLIKDFWGKGDDVEGKTFSELLPELTDQPFPGILNDVYTTGIPFSGYEILTQLNRHGKMEDHYFNVVYQPHYEADETISGVVTVVYEVTEMVVGRKKLEVQASMVSQLLMTAPGFVCILKGPDHVYELVNEKYQSLFGKRRLEGKPIMIALPELQGQGFDILLDNVYNTGETYVGIDVPLRIARDENLAPELGYFNFSYQPMYDENKKIYSILVFGYEVTEQMIAKKRVEESELHFRQMADLMPAKITNATPAGAVTYFNKSWNEFTGMSFENFRDFGYHNIMHPDEIEEFQKRLNNAAETGSNLEMEMRFLNKEGEYIWNLNRASPVKDENGNIKMWIGVTSEIQKIKDEEILKDNFLSMASHELKTPVTTIKAYVQIAQMMLRKKGDAETLAMINKMGSQVNKLTALIVDLLDFTKIRKGKLIYHEAFFDFNEFVNEIVEDMQRTNRTHTIKQIEGETAQIFGDRDKIGQVVNNLISNAIKYSPMAKNIIVGTKLQSDGIELCVQDFGIGIPFLSQPMVFDQFYRVSGDAESTFPGMGIGLYICSEIIKRQGGKIWLESKHDEGSVFYMWLPFDHRLSNIPL